MKKQLLKSIHQNNFEPGQNLQLKSSAPLRLTDPKAETECLLEKIPFDVAGIDFDPKIVLSEKFQDKGIVFQVAFQFLDLLRTAAVEAVRQAQYAAEFGDPLLIFRI